MRGLLGAAAVVVVVAGMRAARPVLVPLLVAAFVSLVCVPFVNALRRRRVPNGLAVTVVVLGMAGIVSAIGVIVGSSLTAFVQALPGYEAGLIARTEGVLDWLQRHGVDVPNREGLLDAVDPGAALGFAAILLNEVGALLTNGVLILLTVVFVLLEVGSFRYKLRRAVGSPKATFPAVAAFMDGMKRYFLIKTEVSLLTGIIVAVWLAVLGVDFPLLWGLIAFLLNYVPNIGSIIAAIPAVLLALVQLGLGPALLVGIGYLATNMVMGNFLEPRWMGHGVGISPLVVFFSLIAWGWVLGPVGFLLSVPLTMTVKIAAESFPETRWLAILLGPEDVPPDEDAPELDAAGIDADALDAAAERAEVA
ncbi:MAG: AI-2E family transporter [Rubricoccaceae bacterium]|nr:AI-2E family transporter [Rubricoccaceae bacterium]